MRPPPRRDERGRFLPTPKTVVPEIKLPKGFVPTEEDIPPIDELEYQRRLIKQRLVDAADAIESEGFSPTVIDTHVLRSMGWVDAELVVYLSPDQDAEELIVRLQELFEPLPDWRYSYGLEYDPKAMPRGEVKQWTDYIRGGRVQAQTWYGRDMARVAEAGTEVYNNMSAAGVPVPVSSIYFRANWQAVRAVLPRTQRRFRPRKRVTK